MNMSKNSNARYKKRELREKDPNANTRIYFEVRATALRSHLHIEGFSVCPLRTFHKGTSTEELQIQIGSTQLQLSHTPLHKRVGTKKREKYNLVIT